MNNTVEQLSEYCRWLKDDAKTLADHHEWFYGEMCEIMTRLESKEVAESAVEDATPREKEIYKRMHKILNCMRMCRLDPYICRHT